LAGDIVYHLIGDVNVGSDLLVLSGCWTNKYNG